MTAQGTIVGTFQYMAPEQLEGKEADARTDIFAFGAVLLEMLSGRRAFAGESQATLIASIIKEEPQPVSTVAPRAPRAVDRLVRRCLAKRAEDRWQTARDLLAELKWIVEHGADAEAEEAAAGPRKAAGWLPWAVAVAALGVAAFFALRGPAPETGPSRAIRLTIPIPASTEFGDDLAAPPAISPDGGAVVFGVIDDSGNRSLWLRPFDGFEGRALPNTNDAGFAFWSPDSRHVGFFADGKIKRIEVSSGRVQTVTEAGYPRGASWSREGQIVFVPNSNDGTYVVDASGGKSVQLTAPDPEIPDCSHRWPVFLPDGDAYLFVLRLASDGRRAAATVYGEASGAGEIWVVDLERGVRTRLAASAWYHAYPVWSAGGDRVLYASQRTGTTEVYARVADGSREEELIYGTGQDTELFDASPDGKYLAVFEVGSGRPRQDIWIHSLADGTTESLVTGDASYNGARFSPDSKWVAYVSTESGLRRSGAAGDGCGDGARGGGLGARGAGGAVSDCGSRRRDGCEYGSSAVLDCYSG